MRKRFKPEFPVIAPHPAFAYSAKRQIGRAQVHNRVVNAAAAAEHFRCAVS